MDDLIVLGTGAEPDRDRILFAISYTSNGQRIDEALLLDSNGDLLAASLSSRRDRPKTTRYWASSSPTATELGRESKKTEE